MKIFQESNQAKVILVGCTHGDEVLGAKAFHYFNEQLSKYPELKIILANEKAHEAGKRYIDQDLNRSFPGDPAGNEEQKIAHELVAIIKDVEYLLDIHTTTSDIKMTPIVRDLSDNVRRILNFCESEEIVIVGETGTSNALIGYTEAGVSLEFNEEYGKTQKALDDIVRVVEGLLHDKPPQEKKKRRVFEVAGKIPMDVQLPKDARNFEYIPDLGIYPFLLHERAYKDFQGFKASSYAEYEI